MTFKGYPVWYLSVDVWVIMVIAFKLAKCVNNKLENTGTVNPSIQIQRNSPLLWNYSRNISKNRNLRKYPESQDLDFYSRKNSRY